MCPHILTMPSANVSSGSSSANVEPRPQEEETQAGEVPSDYIDGALVTAGATAAEKSAEDRAEEDDESVDHNRASRNANSSTENSPETAPGASAPLSEPALATAPHGEEGPLVSEADPTSNAG